MLLLQIQPRIVQTAQPPCEQILSEKLMKRSYLAQICYSPANAVIGCSKLRIAAAAVSDLLLTVVRSKILDVGSPSPTPAPHLMSRTGFAAGCNVGDVACSAQRFRRSACVASHVCVLQLGGSNGLCLRMHCSSSKGEVSIARESQTSCIERCVHRGFVTSRAACNS